MQAPGASRRPPLAREGIDRAAAERDDPAVLETAFADPSTLVLALVRGRAPRPPGAATLAYVAPDAIGSADRTALLGRAESGAAIVLVSLDDEPAISVEGGPVEWCELRDIGSELSAADAGVFVEALSIDRWLRDASFCPACGSPTQLRQAGWSRHCPVCGREHFPRTDPAVIVAVTDADGERLLLGANAAWGGERYSCFAGFVEAGESAESTIRRELYEEAGVHVSEVAYLGSQAWPYPRSLMLGYLAVADDPAAARPDGEEIIDVRWFTRSEIREAMTGHGPVTLPGPSSIARTLIEVWLTDGGE